LAVRLASTSALALSLGLVTLTEAHAQAAAAKAAPSAASTNVGEIVVTARKREERLVDVPVAISALNKESLDRYATTDMANLTQNVPNLVIIHLQAGAGGLVAIRGMGSSAASGDVGVSPEVSYNLDGVGVTRGRVSQLGLLDPAQVEVLKGPQALYFGKNSPGGVVSVVSPDPGHVFTGYAKAGYETTRHTTSFNGAVTLPINEMLSVRVALNAEKQRGYLRNNAVPQADPLQPAILDPGAAHQYQDGADQQIGRISVKFTPTERFTAVAKYMMGQFKGNSELGDIALSCGLGVTQAYTSFFSFKTFSQVTIPDANNKNCNNDFRAAEPSLNPVLAAKYPLSNGGVPFTKNTTHLFSAVLSYDFDKALITSTTGVYDLKNRNFDANSFTSTPFYFGGAFSSFDQISEELRVSTKFDGPVNFMFGGYYESAKNDYVASNYFFAANPDPRNGNISSETLFHHATDKTTSFFGSLDWKIMDALTLTAGARYTDEKKTTILQNTYVNANIAFLSFFTPEGKVFTVPNKSTNVSPEVTLSWHPQPNFNLYAAFKTGYKSGGTTEPSILSNAITAGLSFRPEKSIGGEVGFKAEMMDGRLSINSDVYRYTFKDLQVGAFISVPPAPPVFLTANAAEAITQGAEVEAAFQVDPDFKLRAHLSYNDAHYSSYKNAPCSSDQTAPGPLPGCTATNPALPVSATNPLRNDLSGAPLSRAPEWTGGVGITYSHDLFATWRVTFNADANYSDSYVTGTSPSAITTQKAFTILNAGIKVHSPDNGLSVSLIGQNLTDELTFYSKANEPGTTFGVYQTLLGPPREITLNVAYEF
jgi:outer membrane receptor protein involved in Fe transport